MHFSKDDILYRVSPQVFGFFLTFYWNKICPPKIDLTIFKGHRRPRPGEAARRNNPCPRPGAATRGVTPRPKPEDRATGGRSYPTPLSLRPRAAAGRSNRMTEARGGGREDQPHLQGAVAVQVQEGLEELSHIEGQEGRRWGDTPRPR